MGTYVHILCQTGQTVYSTVHVLMNDIKINVCQTCQTVQYLLLFPAVKTVAEGHRMMVQGWLLFEEAVETAGAGDLPQLLHYLRGTTTPTLPPAPAPVPMDVQAQQGAAAEPSTTAHSPVK